MDWSELIKQHVPEIDGRTCFYASELAQALENLGAFDLGTIIVYNTYALMFELSSRTFIHIYCGLLHPYQPYHFSHNGVTAYDRTLTEILKLIELNWSDIFNVKKS